MDNAKTLKTENGLVKYYCTTLGFYLTQFSFSLCYKYLYFLGFFLGVPRRQIYEMYNFNQISMFNGHTRVLLAEIIGCKSAKHQED